MITRKQLIHNGQIWTITKVDGEMFVVRKPYKPAREFTAQELLDES